MFLKWKGMEATPKGDFFVRSGPGTVKLSTESVGKYIETRFGAPLGRAAEPDAPSKGAV